ncbi:hypothetical protein J6590_037260 [Homalodisca vitripennis]|nr:hypothetical protein J6590_037260 [Homalodisca vitripennis]
MPNWCHVPWHRPRPLTPRGTATSHRVASHRCGDHHLLTHFLTVNVIDNDKRGIRPTQTTSLACLQAAQPHHAASRRIAVGITIC